MSSVVLKVQNVSWEVDDLSIIHDISLSVSEGEVFGVVGPNGAGKSSLLKCLYGEHVLSSGGIQFNDQPLTTFNRRDIAKNIAVVAQHNDVAFNLTVSDIVAMGLTPHKSLFSIESESDRASILESLDRVGILHKAKENFNHLSGGEQQRCLIARALVQKPKLLIMDEPTNHLDVYFQHQILSLLKDLGITLIISIHDLNLAAEYCDRIAVLNQGELVSCDTVENVFSEDVLKEVFRLNCVLDLNPHTKKPRVTFFRGEVSE